MIFKNNLIAFFPTSSNYLPRKLLLASNKSKEYSSTHYIISLDNKYRPTRLKQLFNSSFVVFNFALYCYINSQANRFQKDRLHAKAELVKIIKDNGLSDFDTLCKIGKTIYLDLINLSIFSHSPNLSLGPIHEHNYLVKNSKVTHSDSYLPNNNLLPPCLPKLIETKLISSLSNNLNNSPVSLPSFFLESLSSEEANNYWLNSSPIQELTKGVYRIWDNYSGFEIYYSPEFVKEWLGYCKQEYICLEGNGVGLVGHTQLLNFI